MWVRLNLTELVATLSVKDDLGQVLGTANSSAFDVASGGSQEISVSYSGVLEDGTYVLELQVQAPSGTPLTQVASGTVLAQSSQFVQVIASEVTQLAVPAQVEQQPEGVDIPFTISFANYKPSSVQAEGIVTIYDPQGQEVAKLLAAAAAVGANSLTDIELFWNSLNKLPGVYTAAAQVKVGDSAYGPVSSSFELTGGEQGSITIVKEAKPKRPKEFEFSGDLGDFSLNDDGEGENFVTFTDVAPGTYDVTELVPSDWSLKDIECVDPDGETTVNDKKATASIDLDAGEEVTCTFMNRHHGSIIIKKEAQPQSSERFSFGGDLGSFELRGDGSGSSAKTFDNLEAGSYEVSEDVPDGSILGGITCKDPDDGTVVSVSKATATIKLDEAETVECTFKNYQRGTITVVKDAVPDSDHAFSFKGQLGSFDLKDDGVGSNSRTFNHVQPGEYDVEETVPSGWSLTAISCVDPDGGSSTNVAGARATIDLDANEAVICTFQNTSQADLAIAKTADSAGVAAGGLLTYRLSFSNLGQVAMPGVVIVDEIPSELMNVGYESTLPVTVVGTVPYTWQVGQLQPGQSGVITVRGTVRPDVAQREIITNEAAISGDLPDKNPSNDRSTVTVMVSGYRLYLPLVLR